MREYIRDYRRRVAHVRYNELDVGRESISVWIPRDGLDMVRRAHQGCSVGCRGGERSRLW